MLSPFSRVTSPEDLKEGMVVYYACALGAGSFYTEHNLNSTPYPVEMSRNDYSLFIDEKRQREEGGKWCVDRFSLKDCNVVENTYNHHRLFFDEDAAITYVENCKLLNIGARDHRDYSCLDFEFYDYPGPDFDYDEEFC